MCLVTRYVCGVEARQLDMSGAPWGRRWRCWPRRYVHGVSAGEDGWGGSPELGLSRSFLESWAERVS